MQIIELITEQETDSLCRHHADRTCPFRIIWIGYGPRHQTPAAFAAGLAALADTRTDSQ
jgi:hypothetical protein